MFAGAYAGRRVLVTGHSGFKGSWLCAWLLGLGAEVVGYSEREMPLAAELGLSRRMRSVQGDVADPDAVEAVFRNAKPEIVFHLAAQPLVRASYERPLETWRANVMGTAVVLEAVRRAEGLRACVVVTSDKCYENREQIWGYRETDPMGGYDPYSASKGAAELAVASWRRAFCAGAGAPAIASARAGNVIGGGDRAEDRLVVDFVQAMRAGRALRIRNPDATRPWQHVLEPLSGYLWLGARLLEEGKPWAEAWNFGPDVPGMVTVAELARLLVEAWGEGRVIDASDGRGPHEAGLLHLDCAKARSRLRWSGIWDVSRTVRETVRWYRSHDQGVDPWELTMSQIGSYAQDALQAGQAWADG